MKELNGTWRYQSFCPLAAVADRTQSPPKVLIPAQMAGPWVPSALMEFTTDEFHKITGTATLGPLTFEISGSITPAMDTIPEGIELVIIREATQSRYNLRGFFLAQSNHIVGTVVAISNDLGLQPVGTSGPFILFPETA